MEVFGSDDEKIGRVFETSLRWSVVATGLVVPKDRCAPVDTVDRIGADGIVSLRYTKDHALEEGWGTDPASIEPDAKAFDPFVG